MLLTFEGVELPREDEIILLALIILDISYEYDVEPS